MARAKTIRTAFSVSLEFEEAHGFFKNSNIIGVDEVGRGCLAGPVYAAAAWVSSDFLKSCGWGNALRPKELESSTWLLKLGDSKTIKPELRDELCEKILASPFRVATAFATAKEIDEINILKASHLAMERAVAKLENALACEKIQYADNKVLVDGNLLPKGLKMRGVPIVKGDARSLLIAAASIVAKVTRDQWMGELDQKFPGYGMKDHKGYPTPKHWEALAQFGPTSEHRMSFNGVAQDDA